MEAELVAVGSWTCEESLERKSTDEAVAKITGNVERAETGEVAEEIATREREFPPPATP